MILFMNVSDKKYNKIKGKGKAIINTPIHRNNTLVK